MVLSGGDMGGETVEWVSQGTLPDGREYTIVAGLVYVKEGDDGIFAGRVA